jgi:hypothetical protein
MMEEVICFSSYSQEMSTVCRWCSSLAIVLATDDVQAHLSAPAPETKTEHISLCVWAVSSWNLHRCYIWTTRCTRLPKMST